MGDRVRRMDKLDLVRKMGSRFFLVISLFIVFVGIVLFVSVYGVSDLSGVTVERGKMDRFIGFWQCDDYDSLDFEIVFEFFYNDSFEMRIIDSKGDIFGSWGSYQIMYDGVSMSLVCDSVFFGMAGNVCVFDYEFSDDDGRLCLFNREPGFLDISLMRV